MKSLKKIAVILIVVFVGIQFIPTEHNESTEVLASDFMVMYEVPKRVEAKIKASCYDCHSNNTYYPWYNEIQPIAWFLENHILKAKEELNFSEFGNYSKRRKRGKLKSIINQIRDDEMPMTSYTLMHADAKLTESEKEELMDWMGQLKETL